jgi:RNA polymerase sigma-70 factor (ECF subfamily)
VINLIRLGSQPFSAKTATEPPQADTRILDAVFESLVETHYRRTYSLIYRMIRSEADAADLTQETFVRVYKALPRLRAEGAQSAWIRRIATNLCLDYIRRRNATPSTSSIDARVSEESDVLLSWDIADPSSEPDLLFASKERTNILHRAIETLQEEYRTVILLHHIEEMRVEEIADALNVPAGTIKSRLSRARKELRRKLSPYFDPDLLAGR